MSYHLGVQPWQMDDLKPAELAHLEAALKELAKGGAR